jgi:hypothetical protein
VHQLELAVRNSLHISGRPVANVDTLGFWRWRHVLGVSRDQLEASRGAAVWLLLDQRGSGARSPWPPEQIASQESRVLPLVDRSATLVGLQCERYHYL